MFLLLSFPKGVVKIVVADNDSVEVDDYVEDGLEEEFHNPDDFVQVISINE